MLWASVHPAPALAPRSWGCRSNDKDLGKNPLGMCKQGEEREPVVTVLASGSTQEFNSETSPKRPHACATILHARSQGVAESKCTWKVGWIIQSRTHSIKVDSPILPLEQGVHVAVQHGEKPVKPCVPPCRSKADPGFVKQAP